MNTVKRMSVLLAVLTLIPLAWGQIATNEQPATTNEPPISLVIALMDGSRLIGVPGIVSIPVQTAYAKLDIALKHVRSITVEKNRELAVFEMTNGDRVKGAMILKTLDLQTAFGKVSVGLEQITKIDVSYGAQSELTDYVQAIGNAQMDTTEKKFGTGSLLIDGNEVNPSYLRLADKDDWNFTATHGTIDFWVKVNTMPSVAAHLVSTCSNAQNTASYIKPSGIIAIGKAGLNEIASARGVIRTGIWYHVAFVKNGNTTTIYVDGINKASADTAVWTDSDQNLTIGAGWDGGELYTGNIWIDELRISKGIARWINDFTPSTEPYAYNDANTKLLLHCDGAR